MRGKIAKPLSSRIIDPDVHAGHRAQAARGEFSETGRLPSLAIVPVRPSSLPCFRGLAPQVDPLAVRMGGPSRLI